MDDLLYPLQAANCALRDRSLSKISRLIPGSSVRSRVRSRLVYFSTPKEDLNHRRGEEKEKEGDEEDGERKKMKIGRYQKKKPRRKNPPNA